MNEKQLEKIELILLILFLKMHEVNKSIQVE